MDCNNGIKITKKKIVVLSSAASEIAASEIAASEIAASEIAATTYVAFILTHNAAKAA
jgi:hypothetical protein